MNKPRMGRPRGSGPRIKAVSEALARYNGPDLGFAIAALVAGVYHLRHMPVPYKPIADELREITGVSVDSRVIHQWLDQAGERLRQAEEKRKENEQ